MATSLARYRFIICAPKRSHMVQKLRKSVNDIQRYSTKYASFWPCRTRRSQMSSVNSGVTGPNFTKFSHDIQASLRSRYPIPFLNARATKVGSLTFFSQNWLPWQHSLRYRKESSRSIICTQTAFIW